MKQYISIPRDVVNAPMYAFDKLDGSNIRAEVDPRKGFLKFGSRKVLLGEDHPYLGPAESLIRETYKDLPSILKSERVEFATCFFEFYGPKSFAGIHVLGDDFKVVLFDVDVYKKGLMGPKEFLKTFEGRVPTAPCLYRGNPTEEFLESVRSRTLEGMTYEGVVCKGAPLKKGFPPMMFKVKSREWIEAVKSKYGHDPKRLEDLL